MYIVLGNKRAREHGRGGAGGMRRRNRPRGSKRKKKTVNANKYFRDINSLQFCTTGAKLKMVHFSELVGGNL